MQLKAYAKLNLALEILSLRPDGYHELRGVMQTVSLADILTIQRGDALSLSVPGMPELEGEANLVLKAARLLAGEASLGAKLTIEKKIPQKAGLGGGSADAAFALKALNRFWQLGRSPQDLRMLAAQLGSDVPFFLTGGSAEVSGRGEVIKPLPEGPSRYWFVLLKPPFSVSTPWAYRAFDQSPRRSDGATAKVSRALAKGDVKALGEALANNMEGAVFSFYPQLAQYKRELKQAGALGAAMSGSGSAVFGLFASESLAAQAAAIMGRLEPELEINVVRSVGRSELAEQEKSRE
jgi:4-diphosphocytidyl-2-C-methyl-D-erythritol kinase